MNAAASVILSVTVLVGLGFILRDVLPHSPVFAFHWSAQEYYIPFNILVFWACVAAAVFAGLALTLRAMIRDVTRLR